MTFGERIVYSLLSKTSVQNREFCFLNPLAPRSHFISHHAEDSARQTDTQRTHNITLRTVHEMSDVLERQLILIISLCVRACVCGCGCGCTGEEMRLRACSLTYSACNANAPYCLRPLAPQYFSTLPKKWHSFRRKKKVPERFGCLYNFYFKHFSIWEEFTEVLS